MREGNVDDDSLVDGLSDHLADELEELQVVVGQAAQGRRVKTLLARRAEQIQA